MEQYATPQAAKLLGISLNLLNRWIREEGLREQIEQQRSVDDLRKRYVTHQQLEYLAERYKRSIGQPPVDTDLAANLAEIYQRLEALERTVFAARHKRRMIRR